MTSDGFASDLIATSNIGDVVLVRSLAWLPFSAVRILVLWNGLTTAPSILFDRISGLLYFISMRLSPSIRVTLEAGVGVAFPFCPSKRGLFTLDCGGVPPLVWLGDDAALLG